jgi:hypothetical protein
MSLRTTVVLLVLVALAGGAIWWFTREGAGPPPRERRLLPGLVAGDVATVTVAAEVGDVPLRGTLTLSREGPSGWLVRVGDERPARAREDRVRAVLDTLRDGWVPRELAGASESDVGRYGLAAGQRVVVEVVTTGGGRRTIEIGAQVSENGFAARVDGRWPPVEIDRQIRDDLAAAADAWRETRLAPFDASMAQAVTVRFPGAPDAGFVARRESGAWQIREPALLEADQALVTRLAASVSALESRGPFRASSGAPGETLVRYEVEVSGASRPFVVEIGKERDGDLAPARDGEDPSWRAVSLAGLELIGQPMSQFRSRRLVPLDAGDVANVVHSRGEDVSLRLERIGTRMFFEPPEAWGWTLHGRRRSMPLDPVAQADFLQLLCTLEAAAFERGPPVVPDRTLVVRSRAGSEIKLGFGKDEAGRRPYSRFGPAGEGVVRSPDLAFLDRPYFALLAREAYTAAWFSLSAIEVEDAGGRKVRIDAVSTAGTEPDFVLSEPRGEAKRRVPREVANPATEKICLLTVDRFASHGGRASFGLDRPAYRIRWLDSGKSQGTPPDPSVGAWITWTVGPRGEGGLNAGEVSTCPELIFMTGPADVDPFLNLLDWAYR